MNNNEIFVKSADTIFKKIKEDPGKIWWYYVKFKSSNVFEQMKMASEENKEFMILNGLKLV
jgi:hypothetical protein